MTDTTHLGLPFIDGSQAQKHVTHNEALRILDAAIQIGVENTTLATPPDSPAAGARYLVPAGASGAWSGQADAIACWEDGAWRFLVPKMGWCVWSAADEMQLVFDGTEWRNMPGGGGTLGTITKLGINAAADSDNRLSVCSNAALFRAIDAADGGTGDMRIQISKEGTDNVASVVFSDAFSGYAEFGLIGSDAFKLKVSNDGASFTEAFTIDQMSGSLTLPRGLALSGVVSPATITVDQDDYDPAGLSACSVLQLAADAARAISGLAGGTEGRVLIVLNVGSGTVTLRDDSVSSAAANRFAFGGDIVLGPRHAALLRYDGTAARWFAIARRDNTGGGGGGGGGDGLSDTDRRNILLDRIYQSKALAAPRRVINAWATGFKAATDADRGINTGASSNIDVSNAASAGYVTPDKDLNTLLLLRFNGINGATSTTDSSKYARAVTISGSSAISTTQKKFGASSLSIPGASPSYISVPTDAAFTNLGSSFTADLWVYFNSFTGASQTSTSIPMTIGAFNPTGSDYDWGFGPLSSGKLAFSYWNGSAVQTISSTGTLSTGVWTHIAFVKSGSTITLYINGVQDGSASLVGSIATTVVPLSFGNWNNTGQINAYLDEVRLSNVVRYAGNFTPASSEYSITANMTLATAVQTTDSNVNNARALIEFGNSDAPTLNTDLTAEVTCDGGTNWAAATLSAFTAYSQGGRTVAETADTACTSGTSFAVRIKTANAKSVPIYGVSVVVH